MNLSDDQKRMFVALASDHEGHAQATLILYPD